jgi:hypothetical protein
MEIINVRSNNVSFYLRNLRLPSDDDMTSHSDGGQGRLNDDFRASPGATMYLAMTADLIHALLHIA